MKDDPLTNCPHCDEPALRRLIGTGAGIIFKGSGFYETDYRKASKESAVSGEGGSEAGSDGTDKKPKEAKSEKTESGPKAKESVASKAAN